MVPLDHVGPMFENARWSTRIRFGDEARSRYRQTFFRLRDPEIGPPLSAWAPRATDLVV